MITAKEVAYELFNGFTKAGMLNTSAKPNMATGISINPASNSDSTSKWIWENYDFMNSSVQAVGYEEYQDDDERKGSEAVYVYLSNGSDRSLQKLEREKDGITIHVRKLSPIIVKPKASINMASTSKLFIGANSEIACGSSCSPANVSYSGTIGALIRRRNDDNLYILSNNHVIGGCNHAPRNTIIMSPAPSDARIGIAPREIGRLEFIFPLTSGCPDFVEPCAMDAALAKVTNPDIITSWQGDFIDGYDTPSRILPPKTGMLVKKFGRTTGLTRGVITTCAAGHMPLLYHADGFNALVYFSNFWFIQNYGNDLFAHPGDSGSLVVTNDAQAAVGLLFSVAKQGACMLPLIPVLTALGGVGLVSGHGLSVTAGKSSRTTNSPQLS